jgi:hypothetical protein
LSPWPQGHGLKATHGTLRPGVFRDACPINRSASMGTSSASTGPSGPPSMGTSPASRGPWGPASTGQPTAARPGPTSSASAPGPRRVPVRTRSACRRTDCACHQKDRRGSTSWVAGTVPAAGKARIAVLHTARTPTGCDSRRPSASRPEPGSPEPSSRPRRPQITSLGVVASLQSPSKRATSLWNCVSSSGYLSRVV